MSENFTFVRRTGSANSRTEVEFAAKKDQIQHFEIILNTPERGIRFLSLKSIWAPHQKLKGIDMKKYFVIAFFLLIPFSPWIASWWHKRNGGSCGLDKQPIKKEEGKS